MAHAYELGLVLRRRYGCFLGAELTPDLVSLRATTVRRALHSGALVLAGLLPPSPRQQWARSGLGALWQPVHFQSVPANEDAVSIVAASQSKRAYTVIFPI